MRVLVVDDDPLILTLLSEYLAKDGYQVVTAKSCIEALRVLEDTKSRIHYLVTDWELPDGTGIDLIRHVRHAVQSHYMYVLMVTSHGKRENLTAALNCGADDFLAKPLDRSELLARMRSGARILQLESRLCEVANFDLLTGLPTRRMFDMLAAKEWSRARRYRLPLTCVIFDIDFFKRINDIHGHAAGDQVLREIGGLFNESVRKSDIICRHGGEEFCAILPETSLAQAAQWAESLRERISQTEIVLDSAVVNTTVSLGVAECLGEMESVSDLIELSDQCLQSAKAGGRNKVVTVAAIQQALSDDPIGLVDVMFRNATVADAMTAVLSSVTPKSTVLDTCRFFLDYRIPSAPVVDHEGNLVGIVSEKDLMTMATEPSPQRVTIDAIMRRNVICYPPRTPLRVVWDFLNRASIRTVLITDENKAVGVISRQNILRWLFNTVWHRAAENTRNSPDDSSLESRQIILARLLADTSQKLVHEVSSVREADRQAVTVGMATKMQDLIDELLSTSGGVLAGRGFSWDVESS